MNTPDDGFLLVGGGSGVVKREALQAFHQALGASVVASILARVPAIAWGGQVSTPEPEATSWLRMVEALAIVNGVLCANLDGNTYVPLDGLVVEVGGVRKIVTVADVSDSFDGLGDGSRTV